MFKFKLLSSIAACAAMLVVNSASANDFPNRPIRVVVPFAAGGVSDTVARTVADAMAAESGKTFIVEYKPGADGIVGTEYVASSAPDGYTILLASLAFVTTPSMRTDLKWNPVTDFTAVSALVTIPAVFVTHPDVPGKSLQEFVSHARSAKDALTYINAGSGSSSTLNVELLKDAANIKLESIPYNRGLAVALPDLLTNRVNSMFLPVTFLEFIKGGKLRPLFVAGPDRLPQLPDVPTAAEAGVPSVQLQSWFAFVTPKGAPRENVEYLNRLAAKALARPEVVQKIAATGAVPMRSISAPDLNVFIAEELRRVESLVKKANQAAAK
jgi:tripartite-type tricarboxylate transporter receptor subunit TctC